MNDVRCPVASLGPKIDTANRSQSAFQPAKNRFCPINDDLACPRSCASFAFQRGHTRA
jgi:hypothetical protein